MSGQLLDNCVAGEGAKYEQLAKAITHQIRDQKYLSGDPLPSIRQLMTDSQLSMTTVVNALNLLESQGVLDRHHNRGYFVARNQNEASPCAASQIAFVTAALLADTNLYNAGLARIYGVDGKHTLSTFSANADLDKYQQLIASVLRVNPAGMILNSTSADVCHIDGELLNQSGVPIVVIGPAIEGLLCDRVEESMASGTLQVVNHLRERGLDQDVAVLRTDLLHSDQPVSRPKEFLDHLMYAGLKVSSDRIFEFTPSHGYGRQPDPFVDAQKQIAQQIAKGIQFRTLICGHDYPAMGAVAALTEAGLRVPEDVAVVSCMRCNAPSIGMPQITSIDYQRDVIGQMAASLLLKRIEENADEPAVHCMGGKLCIGQTT